MSKLEIAKNEIFSGSDLDERSFDKLLAIMSNKNIDLADLYFQTSYSESFGLEDGKVKNAHYSVNKGVGIRAVSGDKTGFAYSDDIDFAVLTNAAMAAKSIASANTSKSIAVPSVSNFNIADQKKSTDLYPAISPLSVITDAQKIQLLTEVDVAARSVSPKIKRVDVSLSGSFEIILVTNNLGIMMPDIRPLVRLNVTVIAEDKNRRESATHGGGLRGGYDYFMQDNRHLSYATIAANRALVNLEAVAAPAGMMPVVLGPGWPGVLLHEAVGHGLEGDFNRKGTSAYAGRIGERVASPLCTVVDDGTIANRRGSLNYDDEGTPTSRTVLIEKGILKGYMQDNLNARLMGQKSTGNGRRESYSSIPMPRMTNTFMLAGNSDPSEIIKSVKKGLYATNFNGGSVDITSGQFVFAASEAYLIEYGKITRPVKGATIIGNGPDVLTKVSMVGNDLELDTGIGTCGKEGQNVPVGVGQPTLKIDEITVGGTSN